MSTSVDHYQEAERLLRRADALSPSAAAQDAPLLLQEAQVHATLALAAITGLSQGFDGMPLRDYDAWFQAASVEAPIPPETDDDAIRVASLSPTGDMNSIALAAWLERVPLGSSLTDIDGDRWYRVAVPTAGPPPVEIYPAITRAESDTAYNIADRDDMALAFRFAPFTVLALGEGVQNGGER
jgi:hypothetical protein